jgi:hypothetical protein
MFEISICINLLPDYDRLAKIMSEFSSCHIIETVSVWEGQKEYSALIRIYDEKVDIHKLCSRLKQEFKQKYILIFEYSCKSTYL